MMFYVSIVSFAQSTWTYTEYAVVENAGGALFTLEYGIKTKGYNGYVSWRITNHTDKPVYHVKIADKEYILSNGNKRIMSGEKITVTLGPGESKTTWPSEPVNSSEYTKQGFSNPVVNISLKQPMITFQLEKEGEKRYGWDLKGTVKMKYKSK